MEITDKEIKEFWERCGFTRYKRYTSPKLGWRAPDGINFPEEPPIDLNNLFKYAVPKDYQQIIFQPDGYCGITVDDKLYEGKRARAEGELPGISLFRALQEVLK